MDTKILVLSPEMVTDEQRDQIMELLNAGGESYMVNMEQKLKTKVKTFVLAYNESELVGVRALKVPDDEYVLSVFSRCGHPEVWVDLEIGYACVSEKARGLGIYKKMTSAMLELVERPVFSVTRLKNKIVIKTLESFGFRVLGSSFIGLTPGRDLVVLVRD